MFARTQSIIVNLLLTMYLLLPGFTSTASASVLNVSVGSSRYDFQLELRGTGSTISNAADGGSAQSSKTKQVKLLKVEHLLNPTEMEHWLGAAEKDLFVDYKQLCNGTNACKDFTLSFFTRNNDYSYLKLYPDTFVQTDSVRFTDGSLGSIGTNGIIEIALGFREENWRGTGFAPAQIDFNPQNHKEGVLETGCKIQQLCSADGENAIPAAVWLFAAALLGLCAFGYRQRSWVGRP